MSQPATLLSDGTDFDRFLHAAVGEDRNGASVTVLSTLARLELDPRKEAFDLAALSDTAALNRLDALLKRFFDVPALGERHHVVAQTLVQLLPRHHESRPAGQPEGAGPQFSKLVLPVIGILLLLLLLVPAWLIMEMIALSDFARLRGLSAFEAKLSEATEALIEELNEWEPRHFGPDATAGSRTATSCRCSSYARSQTPLSVRAEAIGAETAGSVDRCCPQQDS